MKDYWYYDYVGDRTHNIQTDLTHLIVHCVVIYEKYTKQ